MQVILLQRIEKLGQMGDVVNVKPGFARNFLLPSGRALRATDANLKRFESERSQLEARNLELKKEADAVGEKLGGKAFVVIRQAGDSGQLYGSVTPRDIAQLVSEGGFSVTRGQIVLDRPIKTLGLEPVRISLHPEVVVEVTVNIARSEAEAERQARGEDVLAEQTDEEYETEVALAELFEDTAAAEAEEVLAEIEAEEAGEAAPETGEAQSDADDINTGESEDDGTKGA